MSNVPTSAWSRLRSRVLVAVASVAFVVGVALLYGSTLAPSPRDGVQPVEFMDEAFYSVLGRDLSATGLETNIPPSGFADIEGLPTQTWYHWGELWLASAVITIFGTAPVAARHFVVLPLVVFAAAALAGTLVRRMSMTSSRRVFLFGFLACLFLAPVPYVLGPMFSQWAVGMIFAVTQYGLAAVAALFALYCIVVLGARPASWPLAGFVAAAVASILPDHIAIALLGVVGVGSIWVIRIARSLKSTRRLPTVSLVWRRTLTASAIAIVATVIWGTFTGHGLGGGGGALPASVPPFNEVWWVSVVAVLLGAGVLLAVPLAWFVKRNEASVGADVYLGTSALVVAGAIVWGARDSDFNMFHFFFGAIAVIATPVAASAAVELWARSRASRHTRLAALLVAVCVLQIDLGTVHAMFRLEQFGPGEKPIALSLLTTIQQLPPDAKLAYSCRTFDEVSFVVPRLGAIDAHTGRRAIPICFQADVFSVLVGAPFSLEVPNGAFAWAPQRTIYPDLAARPSSAVVATFLKRSGIDYIYADAIHPNKLIPEAIVVASAGDAQILRVP